MPEHFDELTFEGKRYAVGAENCYLGPSKIQWCCDYLGHTTGKGGGTYYLYRLRRALPGTPHKEGELFVVYTPICSQISKAATMTRHYWEKKYL